MIAVLAGTVGAVLGGLLVAHRLRTRGAAPARLLGAGAGVHTAPGIQVLARPDALVPAAAWALPSSWFSSLLPM